MDTSWDISRDHTCIYIWDMRSHMNVIPYECDPIWMWMHGHFMWYITWHVSHIYIHVYIYTHIYACICIHICIVMSQMYWQVMWSLNCVTWYVGYVTYLCHTTRIHLYVGYVGYVTYLCHTTRMHVYVGYVTYLCHTTRIHLCDIICVSHTKTHKKWWCHIGVYTYLCRICHILMSDDSYTPMWHHPCFCVWHDIFCVWHDLQVCDISDIPFHTCHGLASHASCVTVMPHVPHVSQSQSPPTCIYHIHLYENTPISTSLITHNESCHTNKHTRTPLRNLSTRPARLDYHMQQHCACVSVCVVLESDTTQPLGYAYTPLYIYTSLCDLMYTHVLSTYGVATISRPLKITSLFCKRAP